MLKSFTIPSCKVFNPSSKVITFLPVGALASSLFLKLKRLKKVKLNPKGIVGEGKENPKNE
jgi:hypothetical protein